EAGRVPLRRARRACRPPRRVAAARAERADALASRDHRLAAAQWRQGRIASRAEESCAQKPAPRTFDPQPVPRSVHSNGHARHARHGRARLTCRRAAAKALILRSKAAFPTQGPRMTPAERPLSPHLQIYRPQLTSVLSIFHRATGLVLSVGSVCLVWWLVAAATGDDAFAAAQRFWGSWLGLLLLFGWTFS